MPSWPRSSKIRKTWSFHVVVCQRTATNVQLKIYNARAKLLFCSLNLLLYLATFPLPLRRVLLKAVANEETLLLTTFPCERKLENICCVHKMFLNKIRNIFVSRTQNLCPQPATDVARAGKGGNICVGNNVSATMCPRLPVPLRSTISSLKSGRRVSQAWMIRDTLD